MRMPNLSELVLWYLAFLAAIVAHEAAHAWAALKLGDPTARDGGQVTLDPFPHIRREPVGALVVPIVSYILGGWMIGWASTPYDRAWALRYPCRAALMALAGPLANLLMVLAAALLIRLGIACDVFAAPARIGFANLVAAPLGGMWDGLAMLLSIFFSLNLLLLIFNLLPLPPLDSSAIVPLLLSERLALSYRKLVQNSAAAMLGLVLAWKFFSAVFRPLHLLAVNFLYPGAGYH
jgi:Zn-dependent protease